MSPLPEMKNPQHISDFDTPVTSFHEEGSIPSKRPITRCTWVNLCVCARTRTCVSVLVCTCVLHMHLKLVACVQKSQIMAKSK